MQVTEMINRVLGGEHPDTLTNVCNLGLMLESLEKYKETEAMHRHLNYF